MITIYVYILDSLADWELGYVTAELHSGRFFRKGAQSITLKTVSTSCKPIQTMGGFQIVPDCLVEDIVVCDTNVLLLPGADTWNDSKHEAVIQKASALLSAGAMVGAICGATVALANYGLLDTRAHTSNGAGFLEMMSPNYKGKDIYIDKPCVIDRNLITAGSTGGLLWAKQIIEYLDVFTTDTLHYWYAYFSTGDSKYFYALMQSISCDNAGDNHPTH